MSNQTPADIIEKYKDKILDDWIDHLKINVPVAASNNKPAIKNSIPGLIDALVDALRSEDKKQIEYNSQEHGLDRSSMKKYSLRHIVREYNFLKAAIFRRVDSEIKISIEDRDAIMFAIDEAIEQATEIFYKIKQGVQVNARKVAEKKANELSLEGENRENFILSISHDINNPLNNIKGCITLLEDDLEVSEAKEVLEILRRNTDQAETLIRDFLDVGQVSASDQLPVSKRTVNIVTELEREVEVYHYSYENTVDFQASDEKIIINVDTDLLRRAFNNLMSNALKHSGKANTVKVTCEKGEGKVEVSFFNSGNKIPSEKLNKIFDRYYQINNDKKGWGLGLSFVKKVAEAHEGEVDVESNDERTKFTLTLPCN